MHFCSHLNSSEANFRRWHSVYAAGWPALPARGPCDPLFVGACFVWLLSRGLGALHTFFLFRRRPPLAGVFCWLAGNHLCLTLTGRQNNDARAAKEKRGGGSGHLTERLGLLRQASRTKSPAAAKKESRTGRTADARRRVPVFFLASSSSAAAQESFRQRAFFSDTAFSDVATRAIRSRQLFQNGRQIFIGRPMLSSVSELGF